jgi:hypothetical protein
LLTAIALGLFLATACSSGSGGGGGGSVPIDGGATDTTGGGSDTAAGGPDTAGATPLPIDGLAAAMAEVMCGVLVKCPQATDLVFASLETCKTYVAAAGLDEAWVELVADVKAGKVTYDPVKAGQCLAIMGGSCDIYGKGSKAPAACVEVFTGTTADGAACTRDEHCQHRYCQRDPTKHEACPGVCATPGGATAPCIANNGCSGELRCLDGKCGSAKTAAAGQGCAELPCATGLYCDAGEKCQAAIAAAGACTAGLFSCQEGLYCADGDPSGQCVTQGSQGAACTPVLSILGGYESSCAAGLVCVAGDSGSGKSGQCLPRRKLGESCEGRGQCVGIDVECKKAEGAAAGTCVPLPGKGGTCVPPDFAAGIYFTCALPYDCSAAKVCTDPGSEGQPCTLICAHGLTCSKGTCKAKLKLGDACSSSSQCQEGLVCTSKKCAAPVCG